MVFNIVSIRDTKPSKHSYLFLAVMIACTLPNTCFSFCNHDSIVPTYSFGNQMISPTSSSSSSCLQGKCSHHLDDFKTYKGEIVNPYHILKVSKHAEKQEIKKAYWQLCKKYHPDNARQRSILPGKCNNHDEVREEWERIKLSYEILTDAHKRKKYDRNDAMTSIMENPTLAMGKATFNLVGWCLDNVGKTVSHVGTEISNQISITEQIEKHMSQNLATEQSHD